MVFAKIKSQVGSFDLIRENFSKLGIWLENSENQRDIVFGHSAFLDNEHQVVEGGIIARIRQKRDKKVLELKEIKRQEGAIELKFDIQDINSIKEFLKKLGFEEAFEIEKQREKYGYKQFSVCLDDVKSLGRFIEIEKIVNKPEEKEKAMNECKDLLNFLSPSAKIETKKYGDLMQDIINSRKA
jgi:adenylate cyclase, class 2